MRKQYPTTERWDREYCLQMQDIRGSPRHIELQPSPSIQAPPAFDHAYRFSGALRSSQIWADCPRWSSRQFCGSISAYLRCLPGNRSQR